MVMMDNFTVKTVVGSQLLAAVTMKTSNGAYFYRCDSFNFLIRWKDGNLEAGCDSFMEVRSMHQILVLLVHESMYMQLIQTGLCCMRNCSKIITTSGRWWESVGW